MRQFVFVVATSMVVGFFAGLASAESPAVPATQQVSPGPSPRIVTITTAGGPGLTIIITISSRWRQLRQLGCSRLIRSHYAAFA